MSSRSLKLVVLLALVAGGVYACSGDLNPQPLPPADDDRNGNGKETDTPTVAGDQGSSAPPPGASPGADGGATFNEDAGSDAGDAGDADAN